MPGYRKLICLSVLSSLAQPLRKVFSFADALGHLADFLCARRDSAVARTSAHEETAGAATHQHDGAPHPLRVYYCVSMVCRRSCGMARMGARICGLPAWFDDA